MFEKNEYGVSVSPSIRLNKQGKMVNFLYSLYTHKFTKIIDSIFYNPESSGYRPIINKGYIHIYPSFTFTELSLLCQEMIQWGDSQNLENIFSEFTKTIPNTGQPQLYHLASLVIFKDIDKLKSYQLSFQRGDKLNFCPMVTQNVIDRALEKAKEGLGLDL